LWVPKGFSVESRGWFLRFEEWEWTSRGFACAVVIEVRVPGVEADGREWMHLGRSLVVSSAGQDIYYLIFNTER
jgi:hypothetical protein